VDGRQETYSQGLPIKPFADVLRALGAVEAVNLDGGGSSATVVDGRLVSSPSDTDADGDRVERAVGDAIVVTGTGRS
jgi:exopolysaccharide biosynthesis protein